MSTTKIKQATLIIPMYPVYKSVQYELLGNALVATFDHPLSKSFSVFRCASI